MYPQLSFTYDDIKELALKINFKKGEEYFLEGKVGEIVFDGDSSFRGFVFGHYIYEVELTFERGDLVVNCGCPAGHDGICKHSVALALTILRGDFEYRVSAKKSISYKEFSKLYHQSEDLLKLDFLRELFEENKELKDRFTSFVKSKLNVDDFA